MGAREPIFSKTHTNQFCGIGQSTQEPAGPWRPLRPGRWVYEKGAGRAAAGLGTNKSIAVLVYWVVPRSSAALCPAPASPRGSLCENALLLAREPIFSKTHTNEFCGIGKSTQEPAGPWDPLRPGRWVYEKGTDSCGGDVEAKPWHLSTAAFAGRCQSHFIHRRSRVVPYGLPGYRRLRRAPPQHRGSPGSRRGLRGIWEDSAGAREYPVCAEGWAMWVVGGSPDLSKATGGTYRLGMPQG